MVTEEYMAALTRRGVVRRLTAAAALAGCLGPACAADPEITWYHFNLPPLYILDGPQKGEGIVDQALFKHLIPGMPGYQHKVIEAPLQRLEQMIKIQPNACALGLLKNPEREQIMHFSAPFLAQIPPGVLLRRSDTERVKPYLDANGKLSLAKLLADGGMTVGISSARSYGATIDSLLNPYKGKPNLVVNATPSPVRSLLQMTVLGRIDAVPGFPYEAAYYGIDTGDGDKALRFYPLSEQPDYILGYAACSRSEFGAAAIRKIDAALHQRGVLDVIAGYYETWLDEESRALAHRLRKHAAVSESRQK
jgi:uncharacterized protein (TIGR02285 family)